METLEKTYLDDLSENSRVSLIIGEPDSGKTWLVIHYVMHSLNNNLHSQYHLVIPQYKSEQNDTYRFLKDYKDKVFIYPYYDSVIVERITKIRLTERVLFMVDDATGELNPNQDKPLLKLCSTSRHGKGCTIFLIAHASKKVIGKPIRGVVKYIFIHSIDSVEMLEKDIYNDYVSMNYRRKGKNFDNFFDDYNNIMENNEYGCFLIARRTQDNLYKGRLCQIDLNVNQWNLLNETPNKQSVKPKKEITPKITENVNTNNQNHNFLKGIFNKKYS